MVNCKNTLHFVFSTKRSTNISYMQITLYKGSFYFFSKCDQIQTEEILNGKLHFCAALLVAKIRKWQTWKNKYQMKEIKINLSLRPKIFKKNLPCQRSS